MTELFTGRENLQKTEYLLTYDSFCYIMAGKFFDVIKNIMHFNSI